MGGPAQALLYAFIWTNRSLSGKSGVLGMEPFCSFGGPEIPIKMIEQSCMHMHKSLVLNLLLDSPLLPKY